MRVSAGRKHTNSALTSYHPNNALSTTHPNEQLGAVGVARRLRRRCMRCRAGAPGAVSVVPPRSRRRGARPPLPWRRLALGARRTWCSTAPAQVEPNRSVAKTVRQARSQGSGYKSARRAKVWHGAQAPSQSCRRFRVGVTSAAASAAAARSRRARCLVRDSSSSSLARSLPLWGGRRRATLAAPPHAAPRWRS